MEKFSGYFSHAWADLKQDGRWWQPMLILSLVSFIPIVGGWITAGYFYDWAKEASWGMNKPLTRKVGDAGKRLKFGFFAWLITLVWTAIPSIVGVLLGVIPFIGALVLFVCNLITIAAAIVAEPATLRALTYDRLGPGFQFGRILKMARQDIGGLLRCFCIQLVGVVIVCAVVMIVLLPLGVFGAIGALAPFAALDSTSPSMGFNYDADIDEIPFDYYGSHGSYSALAPLVGILIASFPLLLVVIYLCTFIANIFNALSLRAYGYWLGQFKPSQWGTPDDPMPFERDGDGGPGAGGAGQAAYAQPAAPGAADAQPASSTTEPDRAALARPDSAEGGDTCDAASAGRNEGSTAPAIPDESCADVPNPGAIERGFVEDGYQSATDAGAGAPSGSEREALDAAGSGDDGAASGGSDGTATGWRSASNAGTQE